MIAAERFDLRAIAPQAWKNGAGATREIAVGARTGNDFDWRLSVAEVERDAPFSEFRGIDRCIVLLRGEGMRLRAPDGTLDHALREPLVPFRFLGDLALEATLLGGACTDFNVMTRRGAFRSEVASRRDAFAVPAGPVAADACAAPAASVTLLLCAAGTWHVRADGDATLAPLQALLWRAPTGPISARPAASSAAAALLLVRLYHEGTA